MKARIPPGAARAAAIGRADAILAAVICIGALALYVVTLCPTIYIEDAAELSTAAALFGVPHPPGYPLYTLLAGLFVRVVAIGDLAYRSNLFSAAAGALAAAALWWLLRRLAIGRLAAAAAVVSLVTGTTFWSQCLAAEVHALDGLLLIVTLLAIARVARGPAAGQRPGRAGPRWALAGAAIGLLVGHRLVNVLDLPAFVVLLEGARRRQAGAPRSSPASSPPAPSSPPSSSPAWAWAWAGAAAAATGLVYIYLPLAAARAPALATGEPTTWGRFSAMVTAEAYQRHFASGTLASDGQRVTAFIARLPAALGFAALGAPIGFAIWWRRANAVDPTRARLVPLAGLGLVLAWVAFSSLYNVLDVESYFLPALIVLAVFAAVAFEALPRPARLGLVALALAAIPVHGPDVSLRRARLADRYARDALAAAPERAILIAIGDTHANLLGYRQAVERDRPDVVLVKADSIADWYVAQLRRRHPDVAWPEADAEIGIGWLGVLAGANRDRRPVCLTHPITLPGAASGMRLLPAGLLFCEARSGGAGASPALVRSAAFWSKSALPGAGDLDHADVHERMLAFSYATSAFVYARELAEAGDLAAARARLEALVAADPDRDEDAIADAMNAIGRQRSHALGFGRRAQVALAARPDDRDAILAALRAQPN